MKSMNLKFTAAAVVLAAAIGSAAVFAHQSEHGGMGMMGGHMGHMGNMENMEGMMEMMEMMSSMSKEERAAMHAACLKMMESDEAAHSDHHNEPADQ